MTRTIVICGDAVRLPLPDASVDLIVTSPPYFGLRSYTDGGEHYAGQIGSEATPRDYLAALWACTAEWVRVLKPEGSLFVNLGDKYSGGGMGGHGGGRLNGRVGQGALETGYGRAKATGVRDKSLLGLPWRYALGCIDDLGLILRAEIIWDKPNGLPESVTDRVRRSHEQVFHFTRQPRYYSAVDEVREAHTGHSGNDLGKPNASGNGVTHRSFSRNMALFNPLGKLPGSVWPIPSAPLTVPAHLGVDHFAAYPPALVRRIVLGWSPREVCTACGEGRRPVAERDPIDPRHLASNARGDHRGHVQVRGVSQSSILRIGLQSGQSPATRITGYACACPQPDAPARPGIVLDPFGGTGTTALVAAVHGRTGISVDMSADYCRLARWRVSDPAERARALDVPKPPPVAAGQEMLF